MLPLLHGHLCVLQINVALGAAALAERPNNATHYRHQGHDSHKCPEIAIRGPLQSQPIQSVLGPAQPELRQPRPLMRRRSRHTQPENSASETNQAGSQTTHPSDLYVALGYSAEELSSVTADA